MRPSQMLRKQRRTSSPSFAMDVVPMFRNFAGTCSAKKCISEKSSETVHALSKDIFMKGVFNDVGPQ
jgi:hypothetical protein